MNGHLNAALILLDRALEEIESGFVRCETCGDQEETKDLDFVCDIKNAKSEILLVVGKEI
jgi:recombinational DNA repair protein RecR